MSCLDVEKCCVLEVRIWGASQKLRLAVGMLLARILLQGVHVGIGCFCFETSKTIRGFLIRVLAATLV